MPTTKLFFFGFPHQIDKSITPDVLILVLVYGVYFSTVQIDSCIIVLSSPSRFEPSSVSRIVAIARHRRPLLLLKEAFAPPL